MDLVFPSLGWALLPLTWEVLLPISPEQNFFFAEMGPPHHHPGHRMPHPGINEHPPWAGPQHPDFGPPPHGFNGQPPHMRRQGPPHINHDDPSLVPNVPYFDLPAGLMAPLVKVRPREPWAALGGSTRRVGPSAHLPENGAPGARFPEAADAASQARPLHSPLLPDQLVERSLSHEVPASLGRVLALVLLSKAVSASFLPFPSLPSAGGFAATEDHPGCV